MSLSKRGVKLSEKTKEKLRVINTGKTMFKEARQKISESWKDRIVSDKTKNLMSLHRTEANKKKVVQFDLDGNFIKIWDSLKECQDFIGGNGTGMNKVLKDFNKSYKNYRFKYLKDYETSIT